MSWKKALMNLLLVLCIVVPSLLVFPSVSMAPGKILISSFSTSALAYSTSGPPMVAAGYAYTVGLKSDGTVVALGDNQNGQCDVGNWTNIKQIAAGYHHTVGLKSDGTVVAVGYNDDGQCNVGDWTGIIQIAAGFSHTVGLKSDGTVVAVGSNGHGECNVGNWTGITQVAAAPGHTVGLRYDGTVVALGDNQYGQCNVGNWAGIQQVADGDMHTVGLKSDGTVVAVGWNFYGECNVSNWAGIQQLSAARWRTVGLKSDGTVVAVGYNPYGQCNVGNWTNIQQVAAGELHTVGLKSDGTVLAVGDNSEGECNVSTWNLGTPPTPSPTPTPTPAPTPTYYTLTIAVSGMGGKGSGSTDPAVGSYSYPAGAVVPITATPACGCSFEGWTGDINTVGNASSASTTITMNSDYTITANFSFHAFCKPGEIIHFPDSNLAEAICEHLGIYPAKQDIAWDALQRLAVLLAGSAGIIDLTGLEYCTNLRSLDLYTNQISIIAPLTDLTNLECLVLSYNQVVDLTPLTNLSKLRILNLYDNPITDITPLKTLNSLQYLSLSGLAASNMTPLAGLTNLIDLSLGDSNISDMTFLKDLSNLQVLALPGCQIANITPLVDLLANFSKLHTLVLSQNPISNIAPLSRLLGLQKLDLYWMGIPIRDVTPLADLTNLTSLNLARNDIGNITRLANLTNLQELDLCLNHMGNITPLANLTNLQELDLSANLISDISPLVRNSGLGINDSIDLRYNLLNIVDRNRYNQNWGDILALQGRGATVHFDPQSNSPDVQVNLAWAGNSTGAIVDGRYYFGYNAFASIQEAIDRVASPGTVYVLAGTYHERIKLRNGVLVQGAGAATTIIDGDMGGTVVTAYDVDSTARLDGFTIINGNSYDGGGMYNLNSSPMVSNCTFDHNTAYLFGGGMVNVGSSPTITQCTFSWNLANYGGGMANRLNSSPTVVNCTFSDNNSVTKGGGIYNDSISENAVLKLINCTFLRNYGQMGGGIANRESSPAVTNCIFRGNWGWHEGGGLYNESNSSPVITNCTFWDNTAYYDFGGAIYNRDKSSPVITNCILWGDSPQEIYNFSDPDSPSLPVVTYSDIDMKGQPGVYPGTGNINANPLFVNPAGGNFQLQTPAACNPRTICKMPKLSPCIDKGNNTAIIAMFPTTNRTLIKDLGGRTRIIDGDCDLAKTKTVDMGAYEALACGATEYKLFCPVDIMVTDPDGLSISKDTNEIPDATYSEPDLDGDGDLDALVYIPEQKAGDYVVTLTPKPDAEPEDTFTLEVETAGSTVVLAENVPIGTEPIPTYQYSNQPPVADPSDPDGPYAVDEGSCITLNGTGSVDPEGSPLTYAWDLDNNGTFETSGDTPTFCGVDGPATIPVTLRVCDPLNACATASTTVTVNNVPPAVGTITAPVDPVQVNTPITVTASFTDPGSSDTHTALWAWDDGTPSSEGVVNETNGLGTVSGSHAYTTPGVFTITLTVTDKDSGQGTSVFRYIVVYDPTGAFVTGGGWIDSLPGAYPGNSTLTGKATFGFVSKYQKGATIPMGQTEFQFHVANLNFQSTSYDWLVIAGAKAQYKGTGIINGAGNYGFLLSAIDGQATGGGGKDKFRIKIWDKNNNDAPVYDNQVGEPNDYADPKTTISGGSIVIHK